MWKRRNFHENLLKVDFSAPWITRNKPAYSIYYVHYSMSLPNISFGLPELSFDTSFATWNDRGSFNPCEYQLSCTAIISMLYMIPPFFVAMSVVSNVLEKWYRTRCNEDKKH